MRSSPAFEAAVARLTSEFGVDIRLAVRGFGCAPSRSNSLTFNGMAGLEA